MRYLLLGLGMGLGAGMSPGPLLALVVMTSLRRGFLAGATVALSPLVSDTPVVGISVLAVGSVPGRVAALLAVVGGAYVVWLGVSAVREPLDGVDPRAAGEQAAPRSLWRGALVNMLSPHPWLFWVGVGAPVLVEAWREAPAFGVIFLTGFYLLLIGSKVVLAGLCGGGRRWLPPSAIGWAHRMAGGLLVVAGIALVAEFAGRLLG